MSRLIPESMVIEHKITFEKVKSHVRDNKSAYISGMTGIGIGALATLVLRKPQLINVASPVFNNTPVFNNDNSSVVNFGGHANKIVQRLSDKEIWAQCSDAARDIAERHGVSYETARTLLSRHCNGWIPDVYGEQYKFIGQGTA